MPNLNWSELSPLQLGRYAEYYAKMEFASYGYEVYTSEVDDHGVDFVVKVPGTAKFYEVQVKSVRDYGYVFIAKSKIEAHGEKIGVESEYEKYCRFWFTLSGNEKHVQKHLSEK